MEPGADAERIIEELSKGIIEPRIMVVGCGGAGNNIVQSMYGECRSNVETMAVNTDERKLQEINAHKKLLIGKDDTLGKGASGSPEVGERCAICARPYFRDALSGSDIVIIVAGMGGGTGTGVAPVVAEVSKELNAVTLAIAISPFSFECDRVQAAKEGIGKLKNVVGNTIVLSNDRLLDMAGDLPIGQSFSVMEKSVARIVDALCVRITESFITEMSATDSVAPRIEVEETAPMTAQEQPALQASAAEIDPKPSGVDSTLTMR
jgi:cell division protein FtsZ